MRNKLVIRKDINMEVNRFARILISVGQMIEQYKKDGTKVDVLEAYYARELEELEAHFIEEGMFFEWVMDGTTTIGILALSDESIIGTPEFLEPFKIYDPDVKKSNLADVQKEHLRRMKQGRKVEVEITVS